MRSKMMCFTRRRRVRQAQRGATAIEFSLVFSLLFGVFWAILGYALPFFLLMVMNQAASDAARASLAADASTQSQAAYEAKAEALAEARLTTRLAILPANFLNKLSTVANSVTVIVDPANSAKRVVRVRITYAAYTTNPLIPVLTLPGLGPIPNIPGDLVAEASVRLD